MMCSLSNGTSSTIGRKNRMHIRLTKWESRRIVDILRTREVKKAHQAWADNLAEKIEREIEKQKGKEE